MINTGDKRTEYVKTKDLKDGDVVAYLKSYLDNYDIKVTLCFGVIVDSHYTGGVDIKTQDGTFFVDRYMIVHVRRENNAIYSNPDMKTEDSEYVELIEENLSKWYY